jgi:hypothetical protein
MVAWLINRWPKKFFDVRRGRIAASGGVYPRRIAKRKRGGTVAFSFFGVLLITFVLLLAIGALARMTLGD